jgi:hypothetical protein
LRGAGASGRADLAGVRPLPIGAINVISDFKTNSPCIGGTFFLERPVTPASTSAPPAQLASAGPHATHTTG